VTSEVAPRVHAIPLIGATAFVIVEDEITVIDAGMRGSAPRLHATPWAARRRRSRASSSPTPIPITSAAPPAPTSSCILPTATGPCA